MIERLWQWWRARSLKHQSRGLWNNLPVGSRVRIIADMEIVPQPSLLLKLVQIQPHRLRRLANDLFPFGKIWFRVVLQMKRRKFFEACMAETLNHQNI